MVAGGLAGATPHMISATVTAVSRLVFEFKGEYRYALIVRDSNTKPPRHNLLADAKRDFHYIASFPHIRQSRDRQIYSGLHQTLNPHSSC